MDQSDLENGAPNTFVVGHRGGMVVMNTYGNDAVPASWTAFTPDEARRLAHHLLATADAAECKADQPE